MYIDVVPNRKSPPAILLREVQRVGGKVVKKTIANLSKCPPEAVEALRLALRGLVFFPKEGFFSVGKSTPHGHLPAGLGVLRVRVGDTLVRSRPCA